MKNIPTPLRMVLLVLWLVLMNLPVIQASHILGSEFSYTCTSNPNIYTLTMKWYRDCSGVELCANCPSELSPFCGISVSINGAETPAGSGLPANPYANVSFGSQSLTVQISQGVYDVVQLCSGVKSICNNCGTRTPGTYTPGIEVYTFTGTLNLSALPSSCCLVRVGYITCCRNNSISTMISPGTQIYFNETYINRCLSACNSSPVYLNDPTIVVCAGQDFFYNLGASDPDGDSLSYEFGPSLTGPGTSVVYSSPYSQTVPLPYLGAPLQSPPALPPLGISIDHVTGDIRFRPMGNFVSQLVISVKQWRTIGGVPTLVGITRRDLPFYSKFCDPNLPPSFTTYDTMGVALPDSTVFSHTLSAGKSFCLIISSPDAATDTTDITWKLPDTLIAAGATITRLFNPLTRNTNGPKADSIRFCWTPPHSMISKVPYYFYLQSSDRVCPIQAKVVKSFSLKVQEFIISPVPELFLCKGDSTLLNFLFGTGYTLQWLRNGIPVPGAMGVSLYAKDSGMYAIVRYQNGTPKDTTDFYRIVSEIHTSAMVSPPDSTTFCLGGSTLLIGNTGNFLTHKWLHNGDILSGRLFSSLPVNASGSYRLILTNQFGCKDTSAPVMVNSFQKKFANIQAQGTTQICSPDSVVLLSNNSYNWRRIWLKNNLQTGDTTSLFLVAKNSGNYSVMLTDSSGCIDTSNTISVIANSSPPAIITPAPVTQFCAGDSVTLIANTGTGLTYSWLQNNVPVPNQSGATIVVKTSGQYQVQVTNSNNCKALSSPVTITVNPMPASSVITGPAFGILGDSLTYAVPVETGINTFWHPFNGTILSGQNSESVLVRWDNLGITQIYVIRYSVPACSDSISMGVTVGLTGLNQAGRAGFMSISPNPVSTELFITLSNSPTQDVQIRILDIQGKLVKEIWDENRNRNILVSVQSLSPGVYFLHVRSNGHEEVKRFMRE